MMKDIGDKSHTLPNPDARRPSPDARRLPLATRALARRLRAALGLVLIAAIATGCTNGVNGRRLDAARESGLCRIDTAIRPPGEYRSHGVRLDYDRMAPLADPHQADKENLSLVARDPRMLEQLYHDAASGNAQASYTTCQFDVAARQGGQEAARYITGLKCQYITNCSIRFGDLPFSEETASGRHLLMLIGEEFEYEVQRRQLRQDLIAHSLTLLVGVRIASTVYTGPLIVGPARSFGSMTSFRRAFGSAGPGKEWHHIVEQTDGNLARFGPRALHNTKNVIRLDKAIHTEISKHYSRIPLGEAHTVRQSLSTQSFEVQRTYGLGILRQHGVIIE